MDDSWSFRTERGRAWVSDGVLRVEGSPVGLLRSTYHEQWNRTGVTRNIFFLLSLAGTLAWFGRAVPALRDLLGAGAVSLVQWIVLSATAVVVGGLTWRATRSERVPLAAVEGVSRDDRTIRLRYEEDGQQKHLDVEALTDADADEAVEILRLKGVRIRDANGLGPTGRTFRERLAAKVE